MSNLVFHSIWTRPSNYFLKKLPILPVHDPIEEEQQDDNKTDQSQARRSAFSTCKSLLTQRLCRHKAEEEQLAALQPEVKAPEVPLVQRRRPLFTNYRAPEDVLVSPSGEVLKMPPTPRLNDSMPRFRGPSMWKDDIISPFVIKNVLIQRSNTVTPTVQLPVDASLRRKVFFRSSPLRQATGVVDLTLGHNDTEVEPCQAHAESYEAPDGASDEPTRGHGIAPSLEMPLQQRRRSTDLMIQVLKKEFRREVLERRFKKVAAASEEEAEDRAVELIPRRSKADVALKQLATKV
jgi:hypothetical protein